MITSPLSSLRSIDPLFRTRVYIYARIDPRVRRPELAIMMAGPGVTAAQSAMAAASSASLAHHDSGTPHEDTVFSFVSLALENERGGALSLYLALPQVRIRAAAPRARANVRAS